MPKVVVIIPNWNGASELRDSLDSLFRQTVKPHIIVVDNGSKDESVAIIRKHYPTVELIQHSVNKGYAGGVNPGFKVAIKEQYKYAAPFNNDAVADPHWLQNLIQALDQDPSLGIATCKLTSADGKSLDSTGDYYTTWGLPYPRGRGETNIHKYDRETDVFGASGGASLYRIAMLQEIGLFDEKFFAYYEDVDLSFRAQLAGWKVRYVPSALVYHATSTTGNKIKGFFTYQTMKNLPMLLIKDVPRALLPTVVPRFTLVYCAFFFSALQRRQMVYALRGFGRTLLYLPALFQERLHIQNSRKVSIEYIKSILLWDLPPNAFKLRRLRTQWRRIGRR